jgi:regulator of protease activity HflC (stomatin/prohibitin superfamily)
MIDGSDSTANHDGSAGNLGGAANAGSAARAGALRGDRIATGSNGTWRYGIYRLKLWLHRHRLGLQITVLALLFLIVYFSAGIFVFIHSGQAGVLWSRFGGGTDVRTVYLEGVQIKSPWNIMYLYNVRIQRADLDFDVLSRDGLRIGIGATVRYHPVLHRLGMLHQRVGPAYLNAIVLPEVQAIVGAVIARYRPEDLYSLRRDVIKGAIARAAVSEGRERWVAVDDVLLRRVTLPPTIQRAIQSKLEQEQLELEYDYRLLKERKEAERKTLEAQGIRSFQEIVTGGISERYLKWKGIDATLELARSPNAKVVVVGSGHDGLPIILGGLDTGTSAAPAGPASPVAPQIVPPVPPRRQRS